MPFCLDFYTHGFGLELFSDSVKEYFLKGLHNLEQREDPPGIPPNIPPSTPPAAPPPPPPPLVNSLPDAEVSKKLKVHKSLPSTR